MADEKINSVSFYLYDRFPEVATGRNAGPLADVVNHPSHNISTAKFPIGMKVIGRNQPAAGDLDTVLAGGFTLIYLNLQSQGETNVLAARHRVGLDASSAPGTSIPNPFYVTNEVASDIDESTGPLAIALSAMTTGNFGWFWCGGVAPISFVSGLEGYYNTNNTVEIGEMIRVDLVSPGTSAQTGEMGFATRANAVETAIGYAMKADETL